MATYQGNTSSTTLDSRQKVPSFADALTRLMPNGVAPLYLLMSKMGEGTALQVEHAYWTETVPFPAMTLNAAVADGVATTFTVLSTADVVPGSTFRSAATGEILRVETVASATSITVTRGVGNVAATAIGNTTKLYQVGSAFEEASTRPQAQRMQQTYTSNYTQIFRNAWAAADTVRALQFWQQAGGNPVSKDKVDAGMMHARENEKAKWWGQNIMGTKNNMPFHTKDGVESTIRTLAPASNITTAGSTTNYTQLEAAFDPVFNTITSMQTGNTRLLFVGAQARKVINSIGRLNGQYQLMEGQTSFGLQFQQFKITRGNFVMIEHPIFNSNTDWAKNAFAVDLNVARLMYLAGRKTRHDNFGINGQISTDNGIDAVGGVYTSELTWECLNPSAYGVMYNLTAGAAG